MSSAGLPGRVARAFVFRDKEYEVTSSVEDGQLLVQVEEKITADQWKNNFAPKRNTLVGYVHVFICTVQILKSLPEKREILNSFQSL